MGGRKSSERKREFRGGKKSSGEGGRVQRKEGESSGRGERERVQGREGE